MKKVLKAIGIVLGVIVALALILVLVMTLAEYKPADTETVALSMIDIDYFKQVNDNYGHQAGDRCLVCVSDVIKKAAERSDRIWCSRFGGDEFILLYKNMGPDEILETSRMIKEGMHALAMKNEYSKVSDIVTLSQGTYLAHISELDSYNKIMHHADDALYKIKESRRDSYIVCTADSCTMEER